MKTYPKRFFLMIAFIVGCIALIYEIYSLKVIFFYFTENTHAVSITLAAFLSGLAFSSLFFSRKAQKKSDSKKTHLLVVLQIISALYAIIVLRNSEIIPLILDFGEQVFNTYNPLFLVFKFALIFIYLFIPAFFLGGAFPILNGLYQEKHQNRYSDTGTVYFWDTAGAIFGSLITGFVIIPLVGLHDTLIIPIILSGFVTVLLVKKPYSKIIYSCITVGIVLLMAGNLNFIIKDTTGRVTNPRQGTLIPYETRFGDIIFQKQSEYGVVTIGDGNFGRSLYINYRDMCYSELHTSESELAKVAIENTKGEDLITLNIGLGCGFTAEKLVSDPRVQEVTILEINDVIIDINNEFFGPYNNHVLENEKVTMLHANGAEFMRENKDKYYDTIVIDIEEPRVIQSSPMYTVEYIEYVKRQLQPGGVFALWAVDGGRNNHRYNQILYNT